MIKKSIRNALRPLYKAGLRARDIKQQLGIDHEIYTLAIHPSWEAERRVNYFKQRYLERKECK
jgi:hypothetical protein